MRRYASLFRVSCLLAAGLGSGLVISSQSVSQTRPSAGQPRPAERAQPCPDVRIGTLCRDSTGAIGRKGVDGFGGDDVGFAVPDVEPQPDGFGGADVGFVVPDAQPEAFGGADVGFAVPADAGGGDVAGDAPADLSAARPAITGRGEEARPVAMDCDTCDSDDDQPSTPPSTPRDQKPADDAPPDTDEPDEKEDECVWMNPPAGPDQEECDE